MNDLSLINLHSYLSIVNNYKDIPENSDILRQLTVIIPSYNRHEYLIRQIAYWSNSCVTVLILDGSSSALPKNIQSFIEEKFSNIKYINVDEKDVFKRLSLAKSFVSTKYSVMSGDDEFILAPSLEVAINKLEHQDGFVGYIGQSLWFYADESEQPKFRIGYPHLNYVVDDNDVKTRLDRAMETYCAATCYAVMRSDVWLNSWGNLIAYQHLPAAEIEQALVTFMYGGLGSIDDIYWLRSSENETVKIKKDWEPTKISFSDWWLNDIYFTDRNKFIDRLSIKLVEIAHISDLNAKSIIIEAVSKYFKMYIDTKSRRKLSGFKLFASWVRKFLRYFVRKLLNENLFKRFKTILGLNKNEITIQQIYKKFDYLLKNNKIESHFKLACELIALTNKLKK